MTINTKAAPTVEELKLSNGLTVWISIDNSQPKVYGTVVVKAGAKDAPNTGIAHYFEHIMFKGTGQIGTVDYTAEAPILHAIADQYTLLQAAKSEEQRQKIQSKINQLNIEAAQYAIPNDFNNLIRKYGGTALNAGTSYDYTLYYNTFTPEFLEHWCELNSERLIDPVFRLFQSELETVYEEKNLYADNFATEPTQRIFERIAAPHPYQYQIIGSTEHLKNPDLRAMEAFFKEYYVAGNMALILTGDLPKEGLRELLERTFGKIKPGTVERTIFELPQPFVGHEEMSIKIPIPIANGSGLVWRTVPNNHPDQIALTLLQNLLTNEGKTGLLDKLTIDNKVLLAGAMNFALNDLGIFGFIAIPKILRGNRAAQKLIMHEIDRIKRGDFTEEQLEEVKLALRRTHILQTEDMERLSRLLAGLYAQGSNWDDQMRDWERLEKMRRQDVIDVANCYLTDNFLEVKKKTGRYPKDKIAKPPYDPVVAPNQGAKSPFAQYLETLETPELPIKTLDFQQDTERMELREDGLATLFKVDNPDNNLFTLDLLYYRAKDLHPQLEHLASYLDLIGGNGISSHEYNARLQQLGATVSITSRDNYFLIRLSGFDEHFEESLRLLSGFLLHPNNEPKMMSKLKEAKRLNDKGIRKDPETLSRRLLDWAMYGGEAPHLQSLTSKQLRQLKPHDLLSELTQVLQSEVDFHYTGNLPIETVASSLQESQLIERVSREWEGFQYLEARVHSKPTLYFLHDPSAIQAIVRAYLPLGILSAEDIAAMRLYHSYFGSGMGSLLFQEIREYHSLAYGAYGQFNTDPHVHSPKSSNYSLYLSTQADKLPQALSLLEELIQSTPDDLARYETAIEGFRSSVRSYYPKLRLKSRTISASERQGYTKDISLVLLDELAQLSQDQIIDVHNRLVAPSKLTLTIVGDRSKIDLKALSSKYEIREVKTQDLVP